MLEIGTSGLMSGEEKRVVILLLGDLIPRSFSTLPMREPPLSCAERQFHYCCVHPPELVMAFE